MSSRGYWGYVVGAFVCIRQAGVPRARARARARSLFCDSRYVGFTRTMADLEARLRETDDHAVDARSLVAVLRGAHRTSTSERLLHGTACQQRSYIVDCHVDPAYVRLMVAWHGRLGTQFATMMCDGVAARFMNEAFNARMVEWHGRLSVSHVAGRA